MSPVTKRCWCASKNNLFCIQFTILIPFFYLEVACEMTNISVCYVWVCWLPVPPNPTVWITRINARRPHAIDGGTHDGWTRRGQQRDCDSSDAPTENRIFDVVDFPKSPVHFSGHVLLVIGDYWKNGGMYHREALGHSDISIGFCARSPWISGSADNLILIESEYTGYFRSRYVALKSTKIVATAKGEL